MSEHFSQSAHDVSRETEKQCACGNDARAGHWDCARCHALSQSVYRSRQIRRRKQAMSAKIGDMAARNKASLEAVADRMKG